MIEMDEPYGLVLVIIDGISDVMPSTLGRRTPMQAARMPILDDLTARGRAGLMDPVRPGLACGSDTAHLSMFGYDSEAVYRGRGAFEAIGTGVSMLPGDVAFKCNFARLDETGKNVKLRCAGSGPDFTEYCRNLCSSLNNIVVPGHEDVGVFVKHAGGHRLVVSIRPGKHALSDQITNTDPLVDNRPLMTSTPLPDSMPNSSAELTASVVNSLSHTFQSVIVNHASTIQRRTAGKPFANVVLLRGASEQIELPPFRDLHGIRSFLIAPTKIIAGIGATAGIDIVHAPGATGGFDTNLLSKAYECVKEMNTEIVSENEDGSHYVSYKYDLGIIHVKAVDEAGHHRSVEKKVEWFEKSDEMVGVLLDAFTYTSRRKKILFCITGDHTTIAEYGDHTCDPVPIVFTDISPLIAHPFSGDELPSRIAADSTIRFDEIDIGTKGSIGRFSGAHLISTMTQLISSSR